MRFAPHLGLRFAPLFPFYCEQYYLCVDVIIHTNARCKLQLDTQDILIYKIVAMLPYLSCRSGWICCICYNKCCKKRNICNFLRMCNQNRSNSFFLHSACINHQIEPIDHTISFLEGVRFTPGGALFPMLLYIYIYAFIQSSFLKHNNQSWHWHCKAIFCNCA